MKRNAVLAVAALVPLLSACTSDLGPAASTTPTTRPTGASTDPAPTRSAESEPTETRIRFTAGDAEIILRMADNPTSRDLVSMLPLTLEFEDFAGTEKISYLPRELATAGSTGSASANGNLIYYAPWGNIGFYYDADGAYSDQVITLGTIETGDELLANLEDGPVVVELLP